MKMEATTSDLAVLQALEGSRPSSRPGSIHGNMPGLRMAESTPLEDLEEYEPLFPDEERSGAAAKKPLTAADRLKRPELKVISRQASCQGYF